MKSVETLIASLKYLEYSALITSKCPFQQLTPNPNHTNFEIGTLGFTKLEPFEANPIKVLKYFFSSLRDHNVDIYILVGSLTSTCVRTPLAL